MSKTRIDYQSRFDRLNFNHEVEGKVFDKMSSILVVMSILAFAIALIFGGQQ